MEFYFSDINLATADQLFGFMSKDPEGYGKILLSISCFLVYGTQSQVTIMNVVPDEFAVLCRGVWTLCF